MLFLYTGVLTRTTWKYPTARAYRTMLLDAGHFSQTVYLLATALDLGAYFTAATRDADVEDALGLRWQEEILLGVSGVGPMTAGERDRQRAMHGGDRAAFSTTGTAWDRTARS